MGGYKVDFTGVESREFEPLPIGRYHVAVTACPILVGGESSEPYVAWELTVQGGDFDGRKGWLNTSLQPQSLWSTKRALSALGVPEEELEGLVDDMETKLEEWAVIGKEAVMVVGHRKYEGETRQNVRRLLPLSAEDVGEAVPF